MNKDTLFISPIYMKGEDEEITQAILKMAELGNVLVVNQGHRIDINFENVHIIYLPKPVGIWGANHVAFKFVREQSQKFSQVERVLLNMSPKTFGREEVFVDMLKAVSQAKHVIGLRSDNNHSIGLRSNIAASLESEKRALLECFFSTLAGVLLGNNQAISRDGFTGLHAFTFDRYLESKWEWIKAQEGKQPWGGALITQIQSYKRKLEIAEVSIKQEPSRNWKTTLGDTEDEAVLNMLDKCRRLPLFRKAEKGAIETALRQFPLDFSNQPFIDESASERVRELLVLYEHKRGIAVFSD